MEIELHRLFLKDFRKKTKKIREQFVERKNLFVADPFHPLLNNHALGGKFEGCRSINVTGDIRAVFTTKGSAYVFLRIGTHSELYE